MTAGTGTRRLHTGHYGNYSRLYLGARETLGPAALRRNMGSVFVNDAQNNPLQPDEARR